MKLAFALRPPEQVVEARHRGKGRVLLEQGPRVRLRLGGLARLQHGQRVRVEHLGEGKALGVRLDPGLLGAPGPVGVAGAHELGLHVRQRDDAERVARVDAQDLLEQLLRAQPAGRRVLGHLRARAAAPAARPVDEHGDLVADLHVVPVAGVDAGGEERGDGDLQAGRAPIRGWMSDWVHASKGRTRPRARSNARRTIQGPEL